MPLRFISLLLVGAAVASGEIIELNLPLEPRWQRFAGKGKRVHLDLVKVVIALPPQFDPNQKWPILVVSATSDPAFNSSTEHLQRYLEPAAAAGWVLVAADPPHPAPVELDTNELRFALLSAALEEVERRWPESGHWPMAFGGFSGGSKRSGWLAAMFAKRERMPIGIFQGGCNRATAVDAIKLYSPPRRAFRAIPVFLSSGADDEISTPLEHERVALALRADGFSNVRLERYAGSHRLHPPHVAEALTWFVEVARSAGATRASTPGPHAERGLP